MATNEIISKLNELSELRRMADELNAEIEAIQDAIKAHMTEEGRTGADIDMIADGDIAVILPFGVQIDPVIDGDMVPDSNASGAAGDQRRAVTDGHIVAKADILRIDDLDARTDADIFTHVF